ncbi:hypothetical protein DAETH_12900 [Deinococcus aetherius]|uniref:Uncharacterized protein n=1 Tax=Deinococcus aetherius TaxID=200252 RepID=A0ABM8AC30_9DEIO|nr:hypothetical protein DAETH_12900 [Deinococcus aetherius]
MGYYISVTQPHEPIPAPPREASEAEWDRWVEEEARFSVYSERLGSLGYISQWVFQVAAQLELPLLASLYPGGCLETSAELDALEQELDALEREWQRRGLHLPGADVGWGRTYVDLLFPLQCFRNALDAARRTGSSLCVG